MKIHFEEGVRDNIEFMENDYDDYEDDNIEIDESLWKEYLELSHKFYNIKKQLEDKII